MRKRPEPTERAYTTLDSYIAGFLLLRNHIPQLIEQNGKVVFSFQLDDQLLKDLNDYSGGALVSASQMAFACKGLKSQIHSIREQRKEKGIYEQKTKW